jgi:ketosteroid isomerase-like protein
VKEKEMHPHEQLLTRLFDGLNAHDSQRMAACYHEDATFQDVAFTLANRREIHAMWDMICSTNEDGVPSDIHVAVQEQAVTETTGRAILREHYTYRDKNNPVDNTITSTFEFRDGLIFKQTDSCDPVRWANQAFGNAVLGFIPGHVEAVRRRSAMKKLQRARPQAFA